LRAANAAVWEINPAGELFWDENFYALVGLDPQTTPPTTENFLAMVDPRDRERMAAARRAIDSGADFRPFDEYRLIRPDGETVWLENHRTRFYDRGRYVIGITQDVTRRKLAEERVNLLLREASHRAKNQFAVIQAIARETMRLTNPDRFEDAFSQRLVGLARSHDLLIKGAWEEVDLGDLITAHLAPFGAEARATLRGPQVGIAPAAVQYLGMAFHELSTNSAKYGSLSVPSGTVEVTWITGEDKFVIEWRELGGPPIAEIKATGFGTSVLSRLVPRALFGEAEFAPERGGLRWRLTTRCDAVMNPPNYDFPGDAASANLPV
jgi:PAS domain S-box-containing protein